MARSIGPYVYTPERVAEIGALADEYLKNTAMPILEEFAFSIGLTNIQCFYEVEGLIPIRERIMLKKNAELHRKGFEGDRASTSFAIFLLKNLGYSD